MYRKLKGRAIFDGYRIHHDKVLVLDGDKVLDIIPGKEAGEAEVLEGVICPGFVNSHCHLELSHLRRVIPEKTGLVDFVLQVMENRFRFSKEVINEAMFLAVEEMRADGTVAIGDICNTTDSIHIKQQSGLEWVNFIEVSGVIPAAARKRFSEAVKVMEEFRANGLNASLVPHAPYSVSPELFRMLNQPCDVSTIHNQESPEENRLFQNGDGDFLRLYKTLGINIETRPVQNSSMKAWLPLMEEPGRIISVHNTFTGKEDVELGLASKDVYFCLCVNANLYIENAIPPVDIFPKEKVVVGTDSLASNHTLSMREEIFRLKSLFPQIEWSAILQWATLNGARALGIDSRFGSFEKGKTPGFVVLDIKE